MDRRIARMASGCVGLVALLLVLHSGPAHAQEEPLRVAIPPGQAPPPPNQPCDRTRRIFTEAYGEISDGPSGFNYTQDSHCEWLIKAKNDSQYITLTFRSMGTECSYDYIFVYDGDSFRSPLLGSFSGKTEPQRVVATSGSMLILLYSDTNYVLDGFKAEFSVTNCPNNCTNRGKCVNHKCICHGDWMGQDCSGNACPDRCGEEEARGVCSGECRCRDEYSGQSCSLHRSHPVGNEWHWLSNSIEGLSPRAAHTAVYVPDADSLYVFGGYDLNNILSSLQIYRFTKSRWEDEWGVKLKNSHKFDKTHVKEALETDSSQWGLSASASFFRNTLSTLSTFYSDKQLAMRDLKAQMSHGNRSAEELIDDILGTTRPSARYGHAACLMADGFIIYGGKLANGGLSSELWFYNVSQGGGEWTLRARNSTVRPPALTRHTLTLAGEHLYLFGGSRDNGEFSSRLFKIKVSQQDDETDGDEQWEEVSPRGGKVLDVRVVAHTTVYHKSSNSLIVYGGVVAGVARFSKLSDRMFAFQLDKRHWTEIMYPRTPLRDAYIPRERAFHTTTIVGNYLIVFGGYSHRHNKEEICYDNQMYLYHLGCHTWVNQDVLGVGKRSRYPKQQGVFAHAASLRNKNTLLIVGGYHGNVNGDLLAYTLPPMLVVKDEETFEPEPLCSKHSSVTECLSDPECGWCSADGVCYGRTVGANCTTNLQTTRCPGICPALGDCHSCLLHGVVDPVDKSHQTVAHKLGLGQCTWCVQNARCHHKDDNYGVCGEDTPSQSPGWWGAKGTEILFANQCTELDRRPGLTFIKYLHPVNWTMPDHVTIVNATMVDFNAPSSNTHTEQSFNGDMVARLAGFIRPPHSWDNSGEMLRVCASYSEATLRMSTAHDVTLAANITSEASQCSMAQWPALKSGRIMVDLQAKRSVGIGNTYHHLHHSKMGLQHNRTNENAKAFTFEYLEPFTNGSNCGVYSNCLHCLSDSACGWCELTDSCLRRTDNETDLCKVEEEWKYLTLQPSHCANCSNYISCEQCVESGLCEWWAEDARCSRRGRAPLAVINVSQCPAPCYARETCSACLDERGRCVWCEATQQCFSFSVYTSEYQFGLCREWLDQTMPLATMQMDGVSSDEHAMVMQQSLPTQQCKSCARFSNCTSCLRSLSCGWCFDRDNPIEGICMQGDFNRSTENCAVALNTTQQEAEWAYAQCPDVDECGLGLHDCHREAKCTNTHGSYNCHCRRGFIGDGRTSCVRTCFETCIHGYCEGAPNYKCSCNLGWTGADCSINCGCNNHSTCDEAVGKCDACQNWTEGEFCERCSPGSHGNATANGCQPCNCNGHGNEALGVCDTQMGECFCQDNTEGFHCEMCNREFYGDPRDGGQCFFQCEARGMLTHIGRQGIGSMQSHKSLWGGSETRECLWIIRPRTSGGALLNTSLIQLHINRDDLNVSCVDNAVYVYDGLPDLTGNTQQSQLLAVFCNQDSTAMTVEAHTGHLTVYYKQGPVGQGFNAMYSVHSCISGTCQPPHVCTDQGKCVCPPGFTGPHCKIERCPGNCSVALNQGSCDMSYGRCLCANGYGGADCSVKLKLRNIVIGELFNSQLINESLEHLRKTLPRFGHSMVADRRASLWMFGGYSLSHGPLNDIRQFDTKNNTWMQVTVDSTPEAKMPQGRYFQAAEIVFSKQAIFAYGGLTGQGKGYANSILGDFWQFSLQNQRWDEVEMDEVRPPPLAGHTLTFMKDGDRECLVIIGGFSTERGMQNELWEYNINTRKWEKLAATGSGPVGVYGHTTVFHATTQSLYVYGGVEFEGQRTVISNKLFALQYGKMTWSELPVFTEMIRGVNHMPRGRFLHSAIVTDGYMIVFGGQTNPYNGSDVMAAYVFKCNYWVRLTEEVEIVGSLPSPTYAQAMAYEQESGSIYVIGGWDGNTRSRVTRIIVPSDLCELWSSGKYMCRNFMGCSFCSVDNTSHCFSSGRSEVCQGQNARTIFNYGALCDDSWLSKRKCSTFLTCTTCLASWPSHAETAPACQWCEGCGGEGKCISAGQECDKEDSCGVPQTAVGLVNQCPSLKCAATDCESCHGLTGCSWSQNGTDPWQCVSTDLVEEEKWTASVGSCPHRCNINRNCTTCLAGHTSEGGWEHCLWSTQLNECISPSYQPLYCAGGVCGLVLTYEDQLSCPEPCSSFTQCSTCLRHAHCGWCAREGAEGDGVCTEGSIESPTEYPAASTCDIIYASRHNISVVDPEDEFKWYYVQCPPENECINGHHTCNPKSEQCVDLVLGYECVCGLGYQEDQDECIPVCTQGCVRGNCLEPNLCECHFGYVGANCSIQCQCNGHSNCGGPDRLDECLECHNNTMGDQCEKCQRFFVGDPRNNGECIPCTDFCNGHSDLCVMKSSDAHVFNLTRNELEKFLTEGPSMDAVCLRCDNRTDGDRCEGCIPGHFRGTQNHRDACRPCECHGHGNTCDPETGEKCNCGNNTESDATCSASASKNSAQQCWSVQCSKCKETYSGNPIEGHQCYKHINVESKMCFDAKIIDECKIKPFPLRPGQTVFFVIQPRFMNVDIRIIVDVTQGELDLYMSPQEDSFVVSTNQSTGYHHISLDHHYRWVTEIDSDIITPLDISPATKYDFDNMTITSEEKIFWTPHIHDCKSLSGSGFYVKDKHAKDLSTYITLNQCNTLLRVFGLRNRLVLTLPQNAHNLSATRFFMALKASAGPAASYGLVFFRQDQLHIDLFVFFSVFFSCFFLFLAVCVVAWKAKQAADVRRARRRAVVEMLHMAKRPFATVTLHVDADTDTPARDRRGRGRVKQMIAHGQQDVRPMAIEPTADGVAAVGTVFIRLPGKYRTPVGLALASALITLPRMYPTGSRAFLRRRGSTHGAPQPAQPQQPPPRNN